MHTFDLVRGKKVEIAKQGLIKFLVHEVLGRDGFRFFGYFGSNIFLVVRSYILNKELIVISV